MVRMGAEDGTGVSPDQTGFARIWAIQDSGGLRMVAAKSRMCSTIAMQFAADSESYPHARGRQRARFRATAPQEAAKGLNTALSKFDLARDGVLQRITAPTLVMTADRSVLQSVEKVRQYQMLIPKSRLAVLQSDAFHIAAANADECVTNVLSFHRVTRRIATGPGPAMGGQEWVCSH
jgi:pimeloyl-ACP methyl ester carboxylesterase